MSGKRDLGEGFKRYLFAEDLNLLVRQESMWVQGFTCQGGRHSPVIGQLLKEAFRLIYPSHVVGVPGPAPIVEDLLLQDVILTNRLDANPPCIPHQGNH